jgi:hypothetical protein
LNIGKSGKSSGNNHSNTSTNNSTKDKKTEGGEGSPVKQAALPQPAHESLLIEKMSLYLAKMALHDYDL